MRPIRVTVLPSLLLAAALTAAAGVASAAKAPKPAKPAAPAKSLLGGLELFQIDVAHSPLDFTIAWMGLSKVHGAFAEYSGAIALDKADLTRSSVTLVMRTRSLTTFNENRDRDLRTADWFDAEKFPTTTFSSREIVKQGEGYLMRGSLTLHGVTKEVEIPFTLIGRLKDPSGSERIGFDGHTTINRKDYGIVGPARYNALLELGKAMVGDQVDLPLTILAFRQVARDTLANPQADSLWRAVAARGVAPVAAEYRSLRATMPDSLMPVRESQLNAVGFQLVERGKPSDGLEMFKLQAEAYPQSASGPAGMAYAYATLGDRDGAIASAEKAVALNPLATRALEILRRVRSGTVN